MKTTIELSDALMKAARRRARERGITLRTLFEEGLRLVLREETAPRPFHLQRATFKGTGLAEEVRDWPVIRDITYTRSDG